MKRNIILLFIVLISLGLSNCLAQSEATTPVMSFSITKEVKPPLWEMVDEPYFVDADGNHAIDANENCKIVMKLKNVGMGDGTGLTAKISVTGTSNGITVKEQKLSTIKVGSAATVEFPISTNMNTADGMAVFTVYVDEPLGFSTEHYIIRVQTRQFQSPMIVVREFKVYGDKGGTLTKQSPFNLQILLQNIQQGLGENVTVKLSYPDNVLNTGESDLFTFPTWKAGETKTLNFPLIVNARYVDTIIPFKVTIKEKYGKYSQNMDFNLTLNQPINKNEINIDPDIRPIVIDAAYLTSDVDRNIPLTDKPNPHRYGKTDRWALRRPCHASASKRRGKRQSFLPHRSFR